MAARAKSPATPVAQTQAEAEEAIARMGVVQRELKRIEADLGDEVATVKAASERIAAPFKTELEVLQTRVQGWCEANRAALTRGNQVKFAILATGEVKWRSRPPKVSLRSVETVIAYLRERMQGRFLREKLEVDKEALLADPTTAALIPGVSIGSEGEDFVVEPFDAALAMGVSPALEAA